MGRRGFYKNFKELLTIKEKTDNFDYIADESWQNGSHREGGEKHGSIMTEAVSWEHTAKIHKGIQGTAFKNRIHRALKMICKFEIKDMETANAYINTSLNKETWSCLDPRNDECPTLCVQLARKQNEGEDSPSKLYILITYIHVTTFRTMKVDEIQPLIV